jgi:hypothetical protein
MFVQQFESTQIFVDSDEFLRSLRPKKMGLEFGDTGTRRAG